MVRRIMSTEASSKKSEGSPKARASAARLAAVQAVYQIMTNDQSARAVIDEFRLHRFGQTVDGQDMVVPDGMMFTTIVNGVYDRLNEMESHIANASGRPVTDKPKEPLLHAIMLCGAYEMADSPDVDGPVIISDYLDVTHAFYEQGEARLVNGVLDKLFKALR